jgi:signal peptidase I
MKEFIKDVIIAFIIVIAVSAVIKPTIVKESSMEPTLYENNYLLVNKLAYLTKDHPEYGDIIIFKSQLDNDDHSVKKLLVKSVIGIEGDNIEIKGYNVYRNGKLLSELYTNPISEAECEANSSFELSCTVPSNQLFVMGDNRVVSLDSRSESVGFVGEEDVIGKAFIKLYPFNEITLL